MSTKPKRRNGGLLKRMFISFHGNGPWPCEFCGEYVLELSRRSGWIHHRDEDQMNDTKENLTAVHPGYHSRHHNTGNLYVLGYKQSQETCDKIKASWIERKRRWPSTNGKKEE